MTIKKLSVLFLSLFFAASGFAQKHSHHADDLLFLLRQPEHVTQALKTVDQLQSGTVISKSLKPGKYVIVVCGEAVKKFTGLVYNETMQEAKRLGVTIYACGLSMQKFEIKKQDLMPGIQYVENGFIKSFELQKKGYLSIEL